MVYSGFLKSPIAVPFPSSVSYTTFSGYNEFFELVLAITSIYVVYTACFRLQQQITIMMIEINNTPPPAPAPIAIAKVLFFLAASSIIFGRHVASIVIGPILVMLKPL